MVKNSLATKRWILRFVLIDAHLHSAITGPLFFKSYDIFIYLESACHDDEQNGSQSFVLCPRIAELQETMGTKSKMLMKKIDFPFYGKRVFRMRHFQ